MSQAEGQIPNYSGLWEPVRINQATVDEKAEYEAQIAKLKGEIEKLEKQRDNLFEQKRKAFGLLGLEWDASESELEAIGRLIESLRFLIRREIPRLEIGLHCA